MLILTYKKGYLFKLTIHSKEIILGRRVFRQPKVVLGSQKNMQQQT